MRAWILGGRQVSTIILTEGLFACFNRLLVEFGQ